jgi:hypothetical protein
MQNFVISWFPERETTFSRVDYGEHFTQGGDTIFVKTHEPYRPDNITCDCKGTWNARNEHGCAVHFCNNNPVVVMYKKTRLLK